MSRASPSIVKTDVAIVGGGLGGTLAAIVLGRSGHDVALIDVDTARLAEFRVEKIGGDQIEILDRLGLLGAVTAGAERYDHIVNVHRGRIVDATRAPHFGIRYRDFVSALRQALPSTVHRISARVDDVQTGPHRQTVVLGGGGEIEARLVVLATGMGDVLKRRLGIERHVIHERQSLSFGFDIRPLARDTFAYPSLTFYGERFGDGIDYLTLFPVRGAMRANLFTFLDHGEPWVKALRSAPVATLVEAMPGARRLIGEFEIAGAVQAWVMDIAVARNCRRDGVVVIGDAFQTSCPAAGTGVSRLLTDVERLCTVHVPAWLATPGMAADKIAA
ncbi:MAG: FAD-dependent oxidoreductase [Pararhizobium sp.]